MYYHVIIVFVLDLLLTFFIENVENKNIDLFDICDQNYAKRVFLEYGERGTVVADTTNKHGFGDNFLNDNVEGHKKCSVEFITCPSCIVQIKFKYLNISRTCGKATVYDSCGCDYVWIYEPPFEEISGEQFCGRLIDNSTNNLSYVSRTKSVSLTFIYSREYGHAFTLEYVSERNRMVYYGYPKLNNMNNGSQIINSPFFPYFYPSDLSAEHTIKCVSEENCRISLVFSDFQLAISSIIEFFDWNGQRMFVSNGDIFRPPVIVSTGPTLTIRFYANGAFSYGFKATYSFLLGNLNDMTFKPDIGCGGNVNNLGGGITMMNMVTEGMKYFDCVWIITPPSTRSHLKTHLYVKVIKFSDFAGTTELTIRQGITTNEPIVESIRQSLSYFATAKENEHVVPIKQGFYINLKGLFRPDSRLAIVYAAFNYKDCYAGSDFLCNNFRCISALLNCDGFDHCGDNSDESIECSQNPKDRRYRSNTPNFLFPKVEHYTDVSTATMIFLICGFGLIGIIMALALLLYRVNMRARHQRQIQDHIETIHAILEESVVDVDVEEEIIIPDDPPDYEAPPEYSDVIKKGAIKKKTKRCIRCNLNITPIPTSLSPRNECGPGNSSKSCQTTPLPTSPPPPYMDQSIGTPEDPQKYSGTSPEPEETYEVNSLEGTSSLLKPEEMDHSPHLDHKQSTFNWTHLQETLRRSLRYYKSKAAFARSLEGTTSVLKYSSDTELHNLNLDDEDAYWPIIKDTFSGKSFSTDDINSLMK